MASTQAQHGLPYAQTIPGAVGELCCMTGTRAATVLKAFAAAYRGEESSVHLPAPHVAMDCWPWHIAKLLPDIPADAAMAEGSPEAIELLHSQVRVRIV